MILLVQRQLYVTFQALGQRAGLFEETYKKKKGKTTEVNQRLTFDRNASRI